MKNVFKEMHFIALKTKITQAKRLQSLNKYFSHIKLFNIQSKKQLQQAKNLLIFRTLKQKAFFALNKKRVFNKYARFTVLKMKEIKTKILKQLAIKSLRYFASKAKTIKKDQILVKMLYSDNVVFDHVTGLMVEV